MSVPKEVVEKFSICLILDFGSQYTQLIGRSVREQNVMSVIIPGNASMERIKSYNPKALILSGGPNSVHVEGAPQLPPDFFQYVRENDIPVLGICYGMQLIVHTLGGKVESSDKCEYGRATIKADKQTTLYSNIDKEDQQVWMSHGDHVEKLPEGFKIASLSEKGVMVGIEDPARKLFALQYHPEVRHSLRGKETISNFLFNICHIDRDWKMESVLDLEKEKISKQVGADDHVICALSGGVDSTVAATLVHQILGDRLHCVFVDNGLLRYKEAERVMDTFNNFLHLPVTLIDDSATLLGRLKGVTDPETKRKTIGKHFIEVFQGFADSFEKKGLKKPRFLVQGTLYPDIIESCPPPGSGKTHSHTIKSHHNVGGLPENMKFELLEPLKELFKDEVRAIGRLLKIPETFIKRHPFPGPGLAVRILGDVTQGDALQVLREVDEIYINAIKDANLYDEIWQAFAVFLPVKSVGVQGDQRTHSHVVALRAVTSADGMTADWYPFEPNFLQAVSTKICNSVRSVNRVVYDVTSKPPGTIEWE